MRKGIPALSVFIIFSFVLMTCHIMDDPVNDPETMNTGNIPEVFLPDNIDPVELGIVPIVWNGETDKAVAANIKAVQNLTRNNASGIKITSNAHSDDFPGIYFIWDSKQKDNGYLKAAAGIFTLFESFTLTAKQANTYWDFLIAPVENQQKTEDNCYVFFIPMVNENKNINMVFIDNWVVREDNNPPVIDDEEDIIGEKPEDEIDNIYSSVTVLCRNTNHVFSLLFASGLTGTPENFEFLNRYPSMGADITPYNVKEIINLQAIHSPSREFWVKVSGNGTANEWLAPFRKLDFVYETSIGFSDVIVSLRKEFYQKFDAREFTLADFKDTNARSFEYKENRSFTFYSEFKFILEEPGIDNLNALAGYLRTLPWVIDVY